MEVAVLNDRAQGGSSLSEGSIELMIHRSCSRDDSFGVEEILNERQYGLGIYVRGQHFLTFGSSKFEVENGTSTAAFERDLAQRKLLAPWVLVGNVTENFDLANEYRGLTKSLPENVHILTFEPWKDDTFILRLEHFLEKDEDATLSQAVTIDIEVNYVKLFQEIVIKLIFRISLQVSISLTSLKQLSELINCWTTTIMKKN